MGTGASIQSQDATGAGDGQGNQNLATHQKPILRGPLPVKGKPYEFYPARCSASLRPNNLSAFDSTTVYSSKHRVCFVETKQPRLKSSVFRSDGVIYQTKACTLASKRMIVVAQTSAVVLWDFDNQKRVAKHTLSSSEFSEKTMPFMRGITSSKESNKVFVGTSTGRVLVFSDEGALEVTLNVSEASVSDILLLPNPNGEGHTLAVSHSDGAITCWSTADVADANTLRKAGLMQEPGPSIAVSLASLPSAGLLAAGFTCGHIRLYSTKTEKIVAQICGHVRPVSCLVASSHRPQIVSCGEDSVVNVWTVSETSVELSFSEKLEDTLVVGASYIGDQDDTLAIAAFDYEGIFTWKIPN